MGSPERFVSITKREARKLFANNTTFILCPHKLRPGFPFSPHVMVFTSTIRWWKDVAKTYQNEREWAGNANNTAWNLMYDNWVYHNSSYETGYYPAYYIIKKEGES